MRSSSISASSFAFFCPLPPAGDDVEPSPSDSAVAYIHLQMHNTTFCYSHLSPRLRLDKVLEFTLPVHLTQDSAVPSRDLRISLDLHACIPVIISTTSCSWNPESGARDAIERRTSEMVAITRSTSAGASACFESATLWRTDVVSLVSSVRRLAATMRIRQK